MIFPGYGAPNATFRFWLLRLWNTVMNSDSPVSSRFPAPMSAPRKPLLCCRRTIAENRLHFDAIVHIHHAARFGDRCFVRIQLHFDELHVVAENLVVDFVHHDHGTLPRK